MGEISIIELNEVLQNHKEQSIVVDVRRKDERDEGFIRGTIHIPLDELPSKLHAVMQMAEGKNLYFHCRSGMRSANATTIFLQAGFKNAFNVKGGILEWEKAGFQVIK